MKRRKPTPPKPRAEAGGARGAVKGNAPPAADGSRSLPGEEGRLSGSWLQWAVWDGVLLAARRRAREEEIKILAKHKEAVAKLRFHEGQPKRKSSQPAPDPEKAAWKAKVVAIMASYETVKDVEPHGRDEFTCRRCDADNVRLPAFLKNRGAKTWRNALDRFPARVHTWLSKLWRNRLSIVSAWKVSTHGHLNES